MEFTLGAIRSKFDIRDWKFEKVLKSINFAVKLPEEYSAIKNLFPVRNQGSLGSCVAMTVSTMKDWQESVNSKLAEYTSPLFIYSLRTNKPNEGMYPRDAMNILRIYGISLEREFPYNESNKSSPPVKVIEKAKINSIVSYAKVKTIEGLKQALYLYGPCLITVNVYNYSNTLWKPNSGEKSVGGHAMTVIGYNKVGFIIRNSWGDTWGDLGYTVMPYVDFKYIKESWSTLDGDNTKLYKERNYLSSKIKSFLFKTWVNPKTKILMIFTPILITAIIILVINWRCL